MVEVLVQVFDRGERKQEIIPVEESCFEPGHFCWKSIAALKAAVVMEMPFVQVERVAKFGLRPEDKERFFGRGRQSAPEAPEKPLEGVAGI